MLSCRVPASDGQDKATAHAALQHAEQDAHGQDLGKVLREANADGHHAPEEDEDGKGPSHGEALDQRRKGQLEDHVRQIEGRGQPSVLLAD